MVNTKQILSLIAGVAFSMGVLQLGAFANAAEKKATPTKEKIDEIFNQADSDKNGSLSPDEFKEFRHIMKQEKIHAKNHGNMKHLDMNHDGSLSMAEMEAMMSNHHKTKKTTN